MPASSPLTEKLAILGVNLPAWPGEPDSDVPGNWIQRGQAYAEGMQLWRASLRNAADINGRGSNRLVGAMQDLGRQSAWDKSVVLFISRELHGASDFERVQAAAKLVTAKNRTAAQRLGAALVVTKAGFLVCGVDAIKQLMQEPQVSSQDCLELCSLLVAQLSPTVSPEVIDTNDERVTWLQDLSLLLQATITLAAASSATRGEQDQAAVATQLDALLAMAAQSKKTAIPRLEYLSSLLSDQPGEKIPWDQVCEILEELTEGKLTHDIRRQTKREILGALLHSFKTSKSRSKIGTYAELNAHRDPEDPLPVHTKEIFKASARIIPSTPLVLIQNSHEAQEALACTPFWVAYGNVRTGSTMVFNLMRILANSLADGVMTSWVGDFTSAQKFFEMLDDSQSIRCGILKIHSNDRFVNQRLEAGQAKAILTHRNMRDCCYSWWRMLGNKNSPFFKENPPLSILKGFINNEIQAFQVKAKQPHTLLVKEELLRNDTERGIKEIGEFLGLSIHPEFRLLLGQYLSPHSMAKHANAMAFSKNSTGHESTTFLHPDHVCTQGSVNSCSQEVRQEIDRLLQQEYKTSLDDNFYILPGQD